MATYAIDRGSLKLSMQDFNSNLINDQNSFNIPHASSDYQLSPTKKFPLTSGNEIQLTSNKALENKKANQLMWSTLVLDDLT